MTRNPINVDQVSVTRATSDAISYKDDILRRALVAVTDPDKKQRLEKCQCIRCYYLVSRIGCSAMTDQPCGICRVNQLYGSSCTDVLCMKCAQTHDLCKHCGGDVHMRPRRKYAPGTAPDENESI